MNAHSNTTNLNTTNLNTTNLNTTNLHSANIVIVTDYHLNKTSFRWFDQSSGEERTFSRATAKATFERVLDDARAIAGPRGGKVVWIMESTTGWARVKQWFNGRGSFVLANVLQIPLPAKARRKKTDKLDTGRLLREYLNGKFPRAYQPDAVWRGRRRIVALREDLVKRRTAMRNRITSFFAHETWVDRKFWSVAGRKRLEALIAAQSPDDQFVLTMWLEQLDELEQRIAQVEAKMLELYNDSADAQRIDAIKGIAEIAAVSIVARIGSIDRFKSAEDLIGYAGLAPGVHQSDGTTRHLSIGGGGTDTTLRFYLIEATVWARKIPRYQASYERLAARRGRKVARLHVARMMLRSIYKMLKEGLPFQPAA